MRWIQASIAVICALCAAAAQARVIKTGTLAPEGSPWHKALVEIGENWRQATNGKITMRIYPGGIVGDDPDMVRKIRIGQLQAAALTAGGLIRIAPELMALQLPMMFSSYEELDYVRDRVSGQLETAMEAKGFKVLNWADVGWVRFFTKRPVPTLDDLRRAKIFVWAGDTATYEAWTEAGFTAVPLAATDIHGALQSGMIDTVPTTPVAALSYQWFGQATNMTDIKWAPFIGATVISSRVWAAIPQRHRTTMLRIARATGEGLKRRIRSLDDEAIDAMRKYGLKTFAVPPERVKVWERAARGAYPRFIGPVIPVDFAAEVERLRNRYRTIQSGR